MSLWLVFFWCLSTAGVVFCVVRRFNKRTIELAVEKAVHNVKKEMHARHMAMVEQLATKERELDKARGLVKLHEAVPSATTPSAPAAAASAKPVKGKPGDRPAKRQGLDVFAMSRPFTDTAFDELLASTDVVNVEAAPVKGR